MCYGLRLYYRRGLHWLTKENGGICWERLGHHPVLVVAFRDFLRPTENDQLLVVMVLFSFIKCVWVLVFILWKRSALIDERKWLKMLWESGWPCLHGRLLWDFEAYGKWPISCANGIFLSLNVCYGLHVHYTRGVHQFMRENGGILCWQHAGHPVLVVSFVSFCGLSEMINFLC
jgi:hypothetical protein